MVIFSFFLTGIYTLVKSPVVESALSIHKVFGDLGGKEFEP